jgi:hypothetical protein
MQRISSAEMMAILAQTPVVCESAEEVDHDFAVAERLEAMRTKALGKFAQAGFCEHREVIQWARNSNNFIANVRLGKCKRNVKKVLRRSISRLEEALGMTK